MLYIDEIMQAVEASDVENALKLFEKHRATHGKEPEFIAVQAIFYVQTQELETARDILVDGVAKHPTNTDLLYNLGYVYQSLGFENEAKEYYTRSMESTDDAALIDELKQLCAELEASLESLQHTNADDEYLNELVNKSELEIIGIINNKDHDVPTIISELMTILPMTDKPGLIIIKASAADIYALQRDPLFIKEFADFRLRAPRLGYLTIDTSTLSISVLSQDELNEMVFDIDPNVITPDSFRLLVRRLAFGIKPEQTKNALSTAFRTGRLSEEEIANILYATWVDMSTLNEITDLIKD